MAELRSLHPDDVRERLQSLGAEPDRSLMGEFSVTEEELRSAREAAVLIPLVERSRQMSVLLTKRASHLRHHSGEFSFPGGRRDDEDETLIQTALREAHEEIALEPERVNIFGSLNQMPTVSGYIVTSFVGEFEADAPLVASPDEIELLWEIPLHALLDPSVHKTQQREWRGQSFLMHLFEWQGHIVWGATAFMLDALIGELTDRPRISKK
jgi:8-oxo-dGTP pyrophosphatase MutT (NUDIX family)